MRVIRKWQEVQATYMPGVTATPLHAPEDDDGGNNAEPAETTPLYLPSSLDHRQLGKMRLHELAEHERLLRLAQLQDSLVELRHTRKIRHKLLLNHHVQIAGQGQRASTRSRAVLESVEGRITKYVERYRMAYRALLRLDPPGVWQETYLELRDCDNRGPGKERDEEHAGDGAYFRSWIWLSNPRAVADSRAGKEPVDSCAERPGGSVNGGNREGPVNGRAGYARVAGGGAGEDAVDNKAEEETVTEEEVNDVIRVEWTTAFARLERWTEEVELLREEMRRVVAFLEWKSKDWLAKVDVRGENLAPGIRSGLNAYARKQAAIHHNLAASFATFWHPTLSSYGLEHSWLTEYMVEHNIPLPNTGELGLRARGIFKFRLSNISRETLSPVATPPPPKSPAVGVTVAPHPLLPEATYSDDSCLDSDFDSETDWDDGDD